MPIRAVVFDYGLTLVSFEYPTAALLEVMAQVRPWLGPRAPSAAWLLEHVLHPLEADLAGFGAEPREVDYLDFYARAWRRAGLHPSAEVLYRILDLEQQCWDRAVKLADGALDTIVALRGRGLLTAIASNAPFPVAMMRRQLAANGLLGQMDAVVFSSEIGWRKPAAELYQAILERLGVAADTALYVGDRELEDHDGPVRAGMRAIICTQLAGTPPRPGIPTIPTLATLTELRWTQLRWTELL